MPQANITYDTPYNRALASRVIANEAVKAMREQSTNLQPMRLGSFHDPHARVMTGGIAPAEFITNGTSAYYPPINMRSGMEVTSGGSQRFIGVDGAVGGNFFRDFARGFTGVLDLATAPLALIAPPVGVGVGALSRATKALAGAGAEAEGGSFFRDFGRGFRKGFFGTIKALAKPIEMIAPELKPVVELSSALGKLAGEGQGGAFGDTIRSAVGQASKLARKVAPVAQAIFGKKSPFLNKAVAFAHQLSSMMPSEMRGGLKIGDIKKVMGTAEGMARHLAPLLPFAMKFLRGSGAVKASDAVFHDGMMRLGKSMKGGMLSGGASCGGAMSGGKKKEKMDVMDAVESVKPMKGGRLVGNKKDSCGRSSGTRFYGTPCDSNLPKTGGAMSGGKKGGRSDRASIVKKVMAERGVKMIEASKIVKAEGLYKAK